MWGLKRFEKNRDSTTDPRHLNRRGEREDRRSFGPPTNFPFIDSEGKIIKNDRRTAPDRRISNIQVKEDFLYFDKCRFSGKS